MLHCCFILGLKILLLKSYPFGIEGATQSFWASLVAQTVKNPPAMKETWVRSKGWGNIPQRRKWQPAPGFFLDNSMDRGAWQVHEVTKSQTRLSDWHFDFHRGQTYSSRKQLFKDTHRTPLVVQWLRIHLPMQGTWIWSLIQKYSTCCRAAKPMHHNSWAQALEPMFCNRRNHINEPTHHN